MVTVGARKRPHRHQRVGPLPFGGFSATHQHDGGRGLRSVGCSDGLGFGVDESGPDPTEVVAWSDIRAIAETVQTETRAELISLRQAARFLL
jgi:hypothetical protein